MNTSRSSTWACILIRSPRRAPPENGELGSTATTATRRCSPRNSRSNSAISVDLPTPGDPVTPMVCALWALAASCGDTCSRAPGSDSTNEMSLPSARSSPPSAALASALAFDCCITTGPLAVGSPWRSRLIRGGDEVIDPCDDVASRGARSEDLGDAHLAERRDVRCRNDPASKHADPIRVVLLQQSEHLCKEVHMGPREDREADDRCIFLYRSANDLFGRLVETGVDDLETSVSQRACNHLCASVVAIESGLGDDDPCA